MIEPEDRLRWMSSTKKDLKAAPKPVRRTMGIAIRSATVGGKLESVKPLRGDLRDVMEVRADDESGTYRLLYTVKIGKKLIVLHFFQKKSTSGIETPHRELNTIRVRLQKARELYG